MIYKILFIYIYVVHLLVWIINMSRMFFVFIK
jgi:hypothetical protein